MKSFEVIHTITSPYRIHMFNIMDEILRSRGINFHVHFMSDKTFHRPNDWAPSSQSINFNHSFWKDIGPNSFGNKWHINTGLIKHIMETNIDYLLIGGPWASFTGLICSFSNKVTTRKIAWLEGNSGTLNNQPIKFLIKKPVLNQFDNWAVPGIRGEEYIKVISGKSFSSNKILRLPNIIDETKFDQEYINNTGELNTIKSLQDINFADSKKTALIPARLIPEKGLLEFFENIDPIMINDWQILIVGEGPLKNNIQQLLKNKNLDNQVKIIKPIDYKYMPILYKHSDLFIIPSVKDNNPLTVIEAIHSSLPVLASTKIGNYPEAIKPLVNGWGMNPFESKSVRDSAIRAFSSSKDKLKSMGEKSKNIAILNWTSTQSINNFLNTAI